MMAALQRCFHQADTDGGGHKRTSFGQGAYVASEAGLFSAESRDAFETCRDGENTLGKDLWHCMPAESPGRRVALGASLEAVLSAFPFLLPIVELKPAAASSGAVLTRNSIVSIDEFQPREVLRAAVEGLSQMAAGLSVEMAELRRSGEQLAELVPGCSFPSTLRRRHLLGCWRKHSEGSFIEGCAVGSTSGPAPHLWCECVASVTASVQCSVLSGLYEKEALQLRQQDVLDTKFQWWRAVKTCFARRNQKRTRDAQEMCVSRQDCCREAPEPTLSEPQERHSVLSQSGVEDEDGSSRSTLQSWTRCCFCSPVSLAHLLKAHEQLYYTRDNALRPLLQTKAAGRAGREADGIRSHNGVAGVFVKAAEEEPRGCGGAQKMGRPVTGDRCPDALSALRDLAPSVVHGKPRSRRSGATLICGFQWASDKRGRIWHWLWEAAGALGFCASSRFLGMQLLDAYLQHEKCTVDVSKTTDLATAAVAAVLLAAAFRCHWKDVKSDAFLLALLKHLELPSTADDIIRTQAEMLRLLPSFLFTVRSPVDYLICFLSNLRWLPEVLEHSLSGELARTEKGGRTLLARTQSTDGVEQAVRERSSAQICAAEQLFHSIGVRSQESSPHPAGIQRSRAKKGAGFVYKALTNEQSGLQNSMSAQCMFPVLLARTVAHAVSPVKRIISLFEYWRCTGLLGCLEGLVLRCCSAFVASATLSARVPMSRVLAALLLQVFEPYSRYRLQHLRDDGGHAPLQRHAADVEADTCGQSKKLTGHTSYGAPPADKGYPAGLLEWCRFVSTNVFRMQFDADLFFWKLLLQPLTDQLLQLPENRPFLLLWQHGVKEWALLLDDCCKATSMRKAHGSDGAHRRFYRALLRKGVCEEDPIGPPRHGPRGET